MQFRSHVFEINNHSIEIESLENPEDMLLHAAEGKVADPYWGKVWDSAIPSAHCLLKSDLRPGAQTLELGCGCGLLGIVGLLKGLDVTFSDHEPAAVKLAESNAQRNGFQKFDSRTIDWNAEPDSRFDLIIASDVLYEASSFEPLLTFAERSLPADGSFRLGDPGRRSVAEFLTLATDSGWHVQIFDADLNSVLVPAINQFQWIVLGRSTDSL